MGAGNRLSLLWDYLAGRGTLRGMPIEHIVETTVRCNLTCPMCVRATHEQPNEDMTDAVFERLVVEAAPAAEHVMLIGLGEPHLDTGIHERIECCARHGISALLSTNGTLLDERASRSLLETPLEHITLSFDGATKETFERYRRGARFERVRDNFIRFARMKHASRAPVQVVVQMVMLDGTAAEARDFVEFWSAVPGVDSVRIKQDETNVLQPDAAHHAPGPRHACHYLWRGPMYVRYNGEVHPCCQSYMLNGPALGRIGEQPLADLWNSDTMRRMRGLHAQGRGAEVDICSRCVTVIPHPLLVVGSLVLHGRWVRRLLPAVERMAGRWSIPFRLLSAPRDGGR
jgi:radical SAM protein with 4Fe4S-binding SPASM domain